MERRWRSVSFCSVRLSLADTCCSLVADFQILRTDGSA
nr:MAG TPA: hypothetical protein [Caudoviricetes sp.]DAM58442.1 MAG TPA: hypothetical protein [Caudoviricetes sp.]